MLMPSPESVNENASRETVAPEMLMGSSMKIVVQKPTFFRSWIDPPGASSGIYLSFLISAASLSLLFDETRVSGVVSPPRGEWKPAPLLPRVRLLSLTVKARAELGSGA